MALSTIERGVLEKQIDHTLNGIKIIVDMTREEQYKAWLRDKDGVDMAIGLAYGEIIALYVSGFFVRNGRAPTGEESVESRKILDKRLGEIREAVYNCG
jgi:hypothetical protein